MGMCEQVVLDREVMVRIVRGKVEDQRRGLF